MVHVKNSKVRICAFLAGTFLLLGGFCPARPWASISPILKEIKIKNTSKFVRIKFLFKGKLPYRTGAYLNGKTFILLFRGTRKELSRNPVVKRGRLIRGITVYGLPKGVKVKVHLASPSVEYVKYQRRNPPQVVVSLRKVRAVGPSRHPKKRVVPPALKKPSANKKSSGKPREKTGHKEAGKEKKTVSKKTAKIRKRKAANVEPSVKKPAAQKSAIQKRPLFVSHLPSSRDQAVLALFSKAKQAWDAKDYQHASALFRKVAKKTPKTKQGETSAFYWARSLFLWEQQKEKRTPKVVEVYKDILKRFPNAPWTLCALMDLGGQYTFLTSYNQALDTYRRVIKHYHGSPEAEEALFNMGKLWLLRQSFKEAEKTLRGYTARYPRGHYLMEATYLLGDALYYQGDVRHAVETYQKALRRWPRSHSKGHKTLENMAALFEKHGQYDRALDLMFMALNLSPIDKGKAQLMFKIATLYERQRRFCEALKIYSGVIAQYPGTRKAAQSTLRMAGLSVTHPRIKYKGFQCGIDPYKYPFKAYESILKGQRDPAVIKQALLGKGKLLLKNDPQKAEAVLLKLIQSYPDAVETREAKKLLDRAFY